MKFSLLLTILLFLLPIGLKAQEWFPVGASWYYNQIILLQGETYSYFEVVGEIELQGKTAKIITGSCNCVAAGIGGYLYEEDDRVYVYHPDADTFRLLYDFNLVAGDTLIFEADPAFSEDGYFLIDSVTTIQLGTQVLRVQHITHLSYDLVWGNKIIERIGSNGCLYPQVSFCDPLTGGLRCYEDDETGLINFQIPERPCDFITGIDDIDLERLLKVYPNPSSSNIVIESGKQIEKLTLFNSLYIPVYEASDVGSKYYSLDVTSFQMGLYLVKATFNDGSVLIKSLIVHR